MYFDDEEAEKTLHVKDGKVGDLCNTWTLPIILLFLAWIHHKQGLCLCYQLCPRHWVSSLQWKVLDKRWISHFLNLILNNIKIVGYEVKIKKAELDYWVDYFYPGESNIQPSQLQILAWPGSPEDQMEGAVQCQGLEEHDREEIG